MRYHCCAGRPTTAGLSRLSRVLAFFFSFFPPQSKLTQEQRVSLGTRKDWGGEEWEGRGTQAPGLGFGMLSVLRVTSCFLATTVLCRQLWAVPVVNPDGYAANCIIRSRWQRLIRLGPSVGLVCLLLSSAVLRDLPVPGAFAHMGFPSSPPSTTLLSLPLSRHDVPASAVVLCVCLLPLLLRAAAVVASFVWSLGPALSFG